MPTNTPDDLNSNQPVSSPMEPWICANCGTYNEARNNNCYNCGGARNSVSPPPPKHGNTAMMVWSIITLLFCLIPGIVAIAKVRKANTAATAKEAQADLRSARIWNIVGCSVGVLFLIGALAAGAMGGGDGTDPGVQARRPAFQSAAEVTPAPTNSSGEDYIALARGYVDEGSYQEAVEQIYMCVEDYPDSGAANEAFAILDEIRDLTSAWEPQTGEELERTIKYQGGGELTVNAESGPVVVTAVCVSDPSQYVRFYVRKGETGSISLPAYTYEITYRVGLIWFDYSTGFGEFYSDGSYEDYFSFEVSSDNAWITNTVWTLTI